ncbi:MAG: IclR family transcriptional regulator [Bacillota bacterium]
MPRPRLGPPESQLQSLDRALAALELFTPDRPALDLSEVAARLGAGRSTVHRLCSTLVARGYLTYDQRTREYRLGLAAIRLGNAALAGLDVRQAARPHLIRLAELTGEFTFLLVAQDDSAIVVDRVEGSHPLRLTLNPGAPWPLHAGASNKVLLAHLPADRVDTYLSRNLTRVTERTPVDPEALRADLLQIRAQGHAFSVGELTPDVAAYAVPILDGENLLGGLCVAGPASRLRGRDEILVDLKRAAWEIARELGSRACSDR